MLLVTRLTPLRVMPVALPPLAKNQVAVNNGVMLIVVTAYPLSHGW